jgi:hypothetical protein
MTMSDNLEIWTGAAAMAAVCDAVKAAYERGLAEGLRRAEAVGGDEATVRRLLLPVLVMNPERRRLTTEDLERYERSTGRLYDGTGRGLTCYHGSQMLREALDFIAEQEVSHD